MPPRLSWTRQDKEKYIYRRTLESHTPFAVAPNLFTSAPASGHIKFVAKLTLANLRF